MKQWLMLALCAIAMSCQHSAGTGQARSRAAAPSQGQAAPLHMALDQPYHTRTLGPRDVVVLFDTYTIIAPLGTISENEQFWGKIDEDHVDVTNHDLMLKNGIRYGIGSDDNWDFYKKIFDKQGATSQKGSVDPHPSAVTSLPLRTGIDYQDLFYLNEQGVLHGRTYQHCDDLFTLAFESIPDRPEMTRVRLGAIVHDLRYQFVVTVENHAEEITRQQLDHLYDLKLEAEVPNNHFLIVAPSGQTTLPYNLGGSFLTQPGPSQQMETILILKPRPMWDPRSAQPAAPPKGK